MGINQGTGKISDAASAFGGKTRGKTRLARATRNAAAKAQAKKKRTKPRGQTEYQTSARIRNFRCKQVYHVFHRSNFRRNVFLNDEERAAYLNYFFSRASKHHVRVHNFCLMETHVHFVLEQTRRHGISRLMRDLQGLHTRKQNSRVGCIGNLWNQHYGCKHVFSEKYYKALMWYVLQNPVKIGRVTDPAEYRWCGARALTFGGEHLLLIPTSRGEKQPVPIRLWTERFYSQCQPENWALIQKTPLAVDLADQIPVIELILDGAARQFFANQQRVQRLNQLRALSKEALKAKQFGGEEEHPKRRNRPSRAQKSAGNPPSAQKAGGS